MESLGNRGLGDPGPSLWRRASRASKPRRPQERLKIHPGRLREFPRAATSRCTASGRPRRGFPAPGASRRPPAARGGTSTSSARVGPSAGHGAHLPPRAAKAARCLSPPCDFAPALVGFEYRRGGAATPRFEGIVVREEDEARVRAAWEKAEAERREAEERKARRDAARRWRVLMSAVWTRISLREEFGEEGDARAFEEGVGAREDGARGGRGRAGWGPRARGRPWRRGRGGANRGAFEAAALGDDRGRVGEDGDRRGGRRRGRRGDVTSGRHVGSIASARTSSRRRNHHLLLFRRALPLLRRSSPRPSARFVLVQTRAFACY